MKKILYLALMVLPMMAYAQTEEELLQRYEKFEDCFRKLSMPQPHSSSVTLSSGKTVSFAAQSDFDRKAFVDVDQLLEDVSQWKESPYLWQLNHMKKSQAITDTKDLSKWEVERFDEIAQDYFEGNKFAFHIAAHGLVKASGKASNKILIGGQELDAKETAELILKSMNDTYHHILNIKEQEFVVVVHSCHSADGEDNFASQLSKELAKDMINVSVVGAPQTIYCTIQDGKYTEYISSEQELKKENPVNYKWKVYKNGKNTGQGTYDYKSTIKKIQK